MNRTRVVGILGSMGPTAGTDFAQLFVQVCAEHMKALHIPVSGQAFPGTGWRSALMPLPDEKTAA